MDLVELERKLMEAGRQDRPSDRVPHAFSKRIMARLRAMEPQDVWGLWGRALWQGALASVVLCLALSAWSATTTTTTTEAQVAATELSEVYESTIYATSEQFGDIW